MTEASNQTAIEDWVIHTCQGLGLPIEAGDDDFFEAGATSLTVIRLVNRAEEEFGSDALSPENVIENSAVHAIAAAIAENTADGAVASSER
jgi:acyl carrier protein